MTEACATAGGVPPADDEASIRAILALYNAALNGGDSALVIELYTDDGVFMPPFSPSAIGPDAVRKAYVSVFSQLRFDVKFDVAELIVMAQAWAFARTNSVGTTTLASTAKSTLEANQELFIFKKASDGEWRIARYSFSSTNPLGV